MKGKFQGLSKKISPKAKIMLGIVVFTILLTITIISMRKVVTVSIDGKSTTYVTYSQTVESLLKKQGYKVNSNDIVKPSLDKVLSNNTKIKIKKAVPITVVIKGQEHKVMTTEKTVGGYIAKNLNYINKQGGNCDDDDEVTPSRDTVVSKNMKVDIVQVQVDTVAETESLPFNTQVQTDYNKDIKSADQVVQAGAEGVQKSVFKVAKYEDGRVNKTLQSVTVVSQPVDKIVVKGGSYFMASRSGDQIKIKGDTISVTATAYTAGTSNVTATGRQAIRNTEGISTIAVDPSVIPLGSLVYVEGYGKAIAADTGSAIKGNRIDIYLNSESECRGYGRKSGIEVGIIAYPGEW